jgi:uncharacterized BrkB/YihY/UPF0761 family membrane protein
MKGFLVVLMVLCMVAVVGTLFAGLFNLAKPNHDPLVSNKLMRWRVVLQGAALLMFVVLMTLYRSS